MATVRKAKYIYKDGVYYEVGGGSSDSPADLSDLILVQDTQPTTPDNKIWIKETATPVVIPDMDDIADFVSFSEDQTSRTDAEKAQARDNVRAAGEWVLLWENASTGSTFSAQTIPLDLSGSKEIMMSIGWQNDGYAQIDYNCRVGDHVALVIFAGVITSSGAVEAYKRETVVSSSGIEFKACIQKNTNSTNAGTTNNNGCIPYRIYAR